MSDKTFQDSRASLPDHTARTVPPGDPMVEMRGILKTFKNAAGEFTVLKGLDLTIGKGEFVSIVGKSGSGKSTMLNMITGIDHPTGGRMVIGGMDIYTDVTESERSRWRGRNLGIVFQFFQLLPMLTLLENVMLPMDYAGLYDFDERPVRALELLRLVGLETLAYKLPALVSTGQQQLAAIARALACDPPLLVADEPTGNLDSKSAAAIIDLFSGLSERGKTIVMVTHDPSLTARTTRNIIISDGELIDEAVSRALPFLKHRFMLEITKSAGRSIHPAGGVILKPGQPVDHLYLVAHGSVDVLSGGMTGRPIARIGAGGHFGEVELLRGGKAAVGIRAGSRPVELLTVPRIDILRMLEGSKLMAQAMEKTIRHRVDERRTREGGSGARRPR